MRSSYSLKSCGGSRFILLPLSEINGFCEGYTVHVCHDLNLLLSQFSILTLNHEMLFLNQLLVQGSILFEKKEERKISGAACRITWKILI